MPKIQGYYGNASHEPADVLEACCFWDHCQGGTLAQFLPRLSIRYIGNAWRLLLDEQIIGYSVEKCTVLTFAGRLESFPIRDLQVYADGRLLPAVVELRDGRAVLTRVG